MTLDLPFDFLALAQQLHAAGKRIALEFGPAFVSWMRLATLVLSAPWNSLKCPS